MIKLREFFKAHGYHSLSMIFLVCGIMISTILWHALNQRDHMLLKRHLISKSQLISSEFTTDMNWQYQSIRHLFARSSDGDVLSEWKEDAKTFVQDVPAIIAIARNLDIPNKKTDFLNSSAHYDNTIVSQIMMDFKRSMNETKFKNNVYFDIKKLPVFQLNVLCLLDQTKTQGVLMDVDKLFDGIILPHLSKNLALSIQMNGSDVYTAGFSETEKLAQYWSAQIPIHFAGQEFSLRVWPNHQYIIDHISWLPEITFIIGLVITLLTTVLLYLWGMLRRNNFYLARQVSNRTEDLAESEHRYHLLYENSPDLQMSVSITDRSIMQCNQSLVTALKCHSKDEIIGKDLLSIFHSTSHELLVKAYNDLQKEYKSCNVELSLLNPDGSKMPNMVRMSVIRNFYGRIICTMISCKDISEKKALEKLDSMAHYDRATKLPNKNYFQDFLARAFERATRSKKCFAILYIDLDHFKNINDSFGHDTGDLLLVKAAERIHSVVRKDHFLARIGGDEFAIISEELSKPQQAGILADRIVRVFNNRMRLDHRVLNISVSIGIAVYPFAGETIETLLRSADIAMYKAKESGRNNYHYYTSTLHKTHLRTLQIDQALRGAIRNKEFYLNFQPIYDIRTQAVSSVETLIRWRQNKMGHVSPAEFFPIAEENGVIYELSEWLFESVCIQMSAWRKKWPNLKFKVAINCSVLQLEQTDFMTLIESRIEKYGLRYDDFILELTETMLMQQIKNTAFMLKKLSARGIKVAIDDFGTGYSSLNYLKSLPISIIKIDKSFIHDILEDTDAQTIVEAIINLGKTLKIDVIAEGVEKEEQLQLLRKLGCHFIQGFLMSKPMRLEMMENFLHQQQQHQEGQKTVSAA